MTSRYSPSHGRVHTRPLSRYSHYIPRRAAPRGSWPTSGPASSAPGRAGSTLSRSWAARARQTGSGRGPAVTADQYRPARPQLPVGGSPHRPTDPSPEGAEEGGGGVRPRLPVGGSPHRPTDPSPEGAEEGGSDHGYQEEAVLTGRQTRHLRGRRDQTEYMLSGILGMVPKSPRLPYQYTMMPALQPAGASMRP